MYSRSDTYDKEKKAAKMVVYCTTKTRAQNVSRIGRDFRAV